MKSMTVIGYPTFVMTDASGRVIDRWIGYDTAKDFAALVAAGVADPIPLETRERNYAARPTARDAASLGRVRSSRGEYAEAVAFYRAAQKLGANPVQDHVYEIFENKASGYRRNLYSADEVKASADSVLACPGIPPLRMLAVADEMISISRKLQKPEMAAPHVAAAMRVAGGSPDSLVIGWRREMLPDYALIVLRDPNRARRYFEETLPSNWENDPEALGDYARWCWSNRLDLEEADRMVRKGIGLSAPGPDKASLLNTAAEIALARGDCRGAVALAEQAKQEHPGRGYYERQLERFRKELEARTSGAGSK